MSRLNPGTASAFIFNSSGHLWVTKSNFTLVEFTKAQLAKSGAPTAVRTVFGPATGLSWPWAVAVEP